MADVIRIGSDDFLRLIAPREFSDPASPTAPTPVTITGRLYDNARTSTSTAEVLAGIAIIPVKDPKVFVLNDAIDLWLMDRTYQSQTISSIDLVACTITLNAGITAGKTLPIDSLVKTKLGVDIDVKADQFGTIDATKATGWGYQGVITDTHLGFLRKMNVRAEIDFVGPANNRLFKVIENARVVDEC